MLNTQTYLLQDLAQGPALIGAVHHNRAPLVASTACAPTAVQERLAVLWHVIVDHQVHTGDVQAARSNICGDQHSHITCRTRKACL